jgi:hypothetical protein
MIWNIGQIHPFGVDYQDIVLYCKTLLELITQVCPNIKTLMVYLEEMTGRALRSDLPII